MMTTSRVPLTAALVCALLIPVTVEAQESRFRVAFGAAAAAASGEANLALNGSVGYRFSDHLWFEVDVTGIDAPVDRYSIYPFPYLTEAIPARVGNLVGRELRRRGNVDSGQILPIRPTDLSLLAETEGSTFIGTLGLRYELPVSGGRLTPWVSGGLGLARTAEEFSITPLWIPEGPTTVEEVTHTGFAASAGLGASLRLAGPVSLDVDARYFRLSRERNLVRLGGGVSVRF